MMVCGLSREVTLAVLPRLYVEELILELGRRNIHPLTDSSSREDLISLLCDVMIEEYSRGRRAACVNVPREQSGTTTAVTRQTSGNTTAEPAPKRSTACVERERRGSGRAESSFGKQTSTSTSVPVRETPLAKDDTGDVIVVEDDEPDELAKGIENRRQEEAPRIGTPTGTAVRTHQHSRPQPSPVQRGTHSKGPPACNTPDALSSSGIQRVLSPQDNSIRMDSCVERNSRGVGSPRERDVTAQEIPEVEEGAAQPDSSLNPAQPEEEPRTEVSTNVETNGYTGVGQGPTITTDDSPHEREPSVVEVDGPEVMMDTSSNLTEQSSHDTGQKDASTTGAVRPVESLARYGQEFMDSARPGYVQILPGYLQTLPGVSTSVSDPMFQPPNTEMTTTYPTLLEALGTEGSSLNDSLPVSLLGTQQPTCMVKTSEEAMAIWQNLSERNSTAEPDGAIAKPKRRRKNSTCQECGYKAPSNSALVIHMRKHTGEKPYECDVCGYRTAYKTALVGHRMTHNGNRPFMCGECGFRTGQKRHLQQHMTTHLQGGGNNKQPQPTEATVQEDLHLQVSNK
ncbi:hypothetical protein Bbelb_212600 [Branchiostoma belcheri]|nr:hypothetical protein Bbelb_212600 [Branchiostoma belcheri]